MKALFLLFPLLLAGCALGSAYVTPTLDEQTGTTKAQRCVGYAADLTLYETLLGERELSEAEQIAYTLAQAAYAMNCVPAVPE